MTQDEAIAVLFKLVGDKHQCFELVKSVRGNFPGRSLQWCIEKVIDDVRPASMSPKGAIPPLQSLGKTKWQMPTQAPSESSQRTLLRLLNGNVDQAQRLVRRMHMTHPDKSEQWAVDKVIFDLERDRN